MVRSTGQRRLYRRGLSVALVMFSRRASGAMRGNHLDQSAFVRRGRAFGNGNRQAFGIDHDHDLNSSAGLGCADPVSASSGFGKGSIAKTFKAPETPLAPWTQARAVRRSDSKTPPSTQRRNQRSEGDASCSGGGKGVEMISAVAGVVIGLGVGPFAQGGLDEALGFVIGARGCRDG